MAEEAHRQAVADAASARKEAKDAHDARQQKEERCMTRWTCGTALNPAQREATGPANYCPRIPRASRLDTLYVHNGREGSCGARIMWPVDELDRVAGR